MALPTIGTLETALNTMSLIVAVKPTTQSARKLHRLTQEIAALCMHVDREQGTTTYAALITNDNFDQDFNDF